MDIKKVNIHFLYLLILIQISTEKKIAESKSYKTRQRERKDMTVRKKILVTTSTFPRWEGDTEPRFVLDLSKALSKYFDVTVMAPACMGAKQEDALEGVKVIRYHYFPIHSLETLCYPGAIVPRIREKKARGLLVPFLILGLWWKLFRILPQYDIVHAHWLIPQGMVQSFFKKDFIVTGHGSDIMSLNKGIIKTLKVRTLKKAKYVTVVSESLKNKVLELNPSTNVVVQSMGCDLSGFSPENREENYFGQGGQKVVLFVGRLAEVKGVEYLIEAMKEINALLVIVGDGPLKEKLREKADRNKTMFLGAKSHHELKTIYASADIFVMPSVTAKDGSREGFGLVLLEAMASGLPVVGSNSGGIPEMICDQETGLLVQERNVAEIREAILKLINDDEFAAYVKEKAKQQLEKYSYEKIAEKYKQYLEM